ncbi:MAG: hypothetical protein NTZ51_06950 [Proteobacteria bacterium]|nr:hypothetical protein [Pseudomonadota bacterium]
MKKFSATIIIVIAILALVCAEAHAASWQVRNSANSDLPCDDVRAITSDGINPGFWLGTFGYGLVYWDAVADTFAVYDSYNTGSGLPNNFVQSVALDGTDVWVGTWNGLAKFDTVADTWTSYALPTISKIVWALDVDPVHNVLWVATYGGGVAWYDLTADAWGGVFTAATSGLPYDYVQAVKVNPSDPDEVWFGTWTGAAKCTDCTTAPIPVWNTYTYSSTLPLYYVQSIAFDPVHNPNDVWFASYGGVLKFNTPTWTAYNLYTVPTMPLGYDQAIGIDPVGPVVWVGTYGAGLKRFDGTNWTSEDPLNTAFSMPTYYVNYIHMYPGNIVVMGTYGSGVVVRFP